jgi:hypothetical protein
VAFVRVVLGFVFIIVVVVVVFGVIFEMSSEGKVLVVVSEVSRGVVV